MTVSRVYLTRHFRERTAERLFDLNDVAYLARQGAIRRSPEYDMKQGTWEYRAEGVDVEGVALEIVFAIDVNGGVTLVTGIRP